MKEYFKRLKQKLTIKKIDKKQPMNAWTFVILLNLIGFFGFFLLKINGISLR